MRPFPPLVLASGVIAAALFAAVPAVGDESWVSLFPGSGVPIGWTVTAWNDLATPAPAGSAWTVTDGVLTPPTDRGTWLISEREYGDFVLEFEIRLSERGNGGVALRAPPAGDPAFDGMELQLADLRYNTEAKPYELTGAIYRAIAPDRQVYRPTEWNAVRVELAGPHLKVTINGAVVQDVNLAVVGTPSYRHDGTQAADLSARPRRGRIGFQHLSRNNEPLAIRHARIWERSPGTP